jgi:2-keto-4-pentenoate hydratase/2-oxohepta-3-ene-1,7-dioic acid hydratase in catechol pathway
MIFDIAWLIAYCSTFAPLEPGDVIATGTPSGCGSSRTPREFLCEGDVGEVEISAIGTLRNRVVQDIDSEHAFVILYDFRNSLRKSPC